MDNKGTINVRPLETRAISLGQPETIEIPKNYALRSLVLKLKGSVTLSGGSASGAVKDAAPLQLLTSVEVKRNGNDTIFSMPAARLYRLNQILRGVAPALTAPADGAIQANTAVEGTIIIPFENMGGRNGEFETLLKAAGLSSLTLKVNVASTVKAMFDANNDRTGTVGTTTFTLDVLAIEEKNVNQFVFDDLRTSLLSRQEITGASDNFQIRNLPIGNKYKGFFIVIEDDEALSDSVLTNIKLHSGNRIHVEANAETLKYKEAYARGMSALPVGCYYIDTMPGKSLKYTLDVRPQSGNQSLEITSKVAAPSGTCYMEVYGIEHVPAQVVTKG